MVLLNKVTVAKRQNGVLISMVQGTCLGYALFSLQDRGRLFAKPQLGSLRRYDRGY